MLETYRERRISFCTTCMNRLHHLKETLPSNIANNADYSNLEFVILDYNSKDGLDQWIREYMRDYLLSGKLVYYRFNDALFFHRTHSRNMAFSLANGDILCNIDADNYTGNSFARYVNKMFTSYDHVILTTIDFFKTKPDYNPPKDVLGKICLNKSDFVCVGGFDERMDGYGYEDYDLVNRIEMIGARRMIIEDSSFMKFISHDINERFSIDDVVNKIYSVYIQYITPSESSIVILFNDARFSKATFIDNATIGSEDYRNAFEKKKNLFEFSVKKNIWIYGIWKEVNKQRVYFFPDKDDMFEMNIGENPDTMTNKNQDIYYKIYSSRLIKHVADIYLRYPNWCIMMENFETGTTKVNGELRGRGAVVKNFEESQPILI